MKVLQSNIDLIGQRLLENSLQSDHVLSHKDKINKLAQPAGVDKDAGLIDQIYIIYIIIIYKNFFTRVKKNIAVS